jgi:hypothetical protein
MKRLFALLAIGPLLTGLLLVGCASNATTQPAPLHLESRTENGSDWTLDELSIDQAPPAVRATLREVLGDHPLRTLHRETVDNNSTYEAEYDADGIDHAVLLSEDGTVVATSYDIQPEALPQAVRAALWDRYPKGDLREVQSVQAGAQNYFIAQVAEGEVIHKVKVTPAGVTQEVASWLESSPKK